MRSWRAGHGNSSCKWGKDKRTHSHASKHPKITEAINSNWKCVDPDWNWIECWIEKTWRTVDSRSTCRGQDRGASTCVNCQGSYCWEISYCGSAHLGLCSNSWDLVHSHWSHQINSQNTGDSSWATDWRWRGIREKREKQSREEEKHHWRDRG